MGLFKRNKHRKAEKTEKQKYFLGLINNTKSFDVLFAISQRISREEQLYIIPDKVYASNAFRYAVYNDNFKTLDSTYIYWTKEEALKQGIIKAINHLK